MLKPANRTANNAPGGKFAEATEPAGALPETSGRPRVLVVDDNIDAATSLGRLLVLLGREVTVVHSGESAVAQASHFRPHLVILDIGMPGMDGVDAAIRIRALPACQGSALVALTGWGQEHDRDRMQTAGFAAHLVKPVQVDQLQAVLARFACLND